MKILQIGCGGIGSYLAEYMNELIINDVKGTEDLMINVVDGDIVEEKNLKYQNFTIDSLDESKAKSIGERYLFNYENKYIEKEEDLMGYNIIVLAVDNGKVRDLVFRYCNNNSKTKFIDLRSEGRAIAYFTTHKMNTLDKMLSTINVDASSTSCQLKFELEQGLIQQGNKIIAGIGSQLILNELRNEPNNAEFSARF